MSIKGFLEVQEMQEGGPARFTPFAVDPEGSPRKRVRASYEPPTPPTITLPPIAPITPTPTEDLTNFSPDINYNIDMVAAEANAARQGISITPNMSNEYLFALSQENKATPGSLKMDAFVGKYALPVLTAVAKVNPVVGFGNALFGATRGEGLLGGLFGGKAKTPEQQQVAQAQAQARAQAQEQAQVQAQAQAQNRAMLSTAGGFARTFSGEQKGIPTTAGTQLNRQSGKLYNFAGTPFGSSTVATSALGAVTTASVGRDNALFGAAYGQGRGGKGMFSSFAHYASGLNEAEETSIVTNGINTGRFANAAQGKEVIDALVDQGRNQQEIETIIEQMNPEQMQGQPETAPSIDGLDVGFGDSVSVSDFSAYSDMGSDADAPSFTGIGLD
tara:strand:+ start:235 stop:1398 length:1164 start_codon:yes stop_codon:yes gene_type:complete